MTREEHRNNLCDIIFNSTDCIDSKDRRTIGYCIDYFEARTCDNCKYGNYYEDYDYYGCDNEYMGEQFNTYPQYPLCVDEGFGCNKFERKILN